MNTDIDTKYPSFIELQDQSLVVINDDINTESESLKKKWLRCIKPPVGSQLIAEFSQEEKGMRFEWSDYLSLERRKKMLWPIGLQKIAHAEMTGVYDRTMITAVLNCVGRELFSKIYEVDSKIYVYDNEAPSTLLGINGEIGCGKSTVVNYLSEKYNYREYMMAEPLKKIAKILGFDDHQIYGTQEQKLEVNSFWNVSGREFLQKFGTEVCRDAVPRILPKMNFNGLTMWVRLFEKFYSETRSQCVAVSDVRFEDESATIKRYGGIIIRIEREVNEVKKDNNVQSSYTTHASELQASKIYPNVVVKNDGSLEDLYKKIDMIIDLIDKGEITHTSNAIHI